MMTIKETSHDYKVNIDIDTLDHCEFTIFKNSMVLGLITFKIGYTTSLINLLTIRQDENLTDSIIIKKILDMGIINHSEYLQLLLLVT